MSDDSHDARRKSVVLATPDDPKSDGVLEEEPKTHLIAASGTNSHSFAELKDMHTLTITDENETSSRQTGCGTLPWGSPTETSKELLKDEGNESSKCQHDSRQVTSKKKNETRNASSKAVETVIQKRNRDAWLKIRVAERPHWKLLTKFLPSYKNKNKEAIQRKFYSTFHPDDVFYSVQHRMWYYANYNFITLMYTTGNRTLRPLYGAGVTGDGLYGQLTQGSHKRLVEELLALGALHAKSVFVDAGAGTMMLAFRVGVQFGCKVIGFENVEDRILLACSIFLKLAEADSCPPSLFKIGLFKEDIGVLGSLCGGTVVHTFDSAFDAQPIYQIQQLFLDSDTCEYWVTYLSGGANREYMLLLDEAAELRGMKIVEVARFSVTMHGSQMGQTVVILRKQRLATTKQFNINNVGPKDKTEKDVDDFFARDQKEVFEFYKKILERFNSKKPVTRLDRAKESK
jgi:hypothetical protein